MPKNEEELAREEQERQQASNKPHWMLEGPKLELLENLDREKLRAALDRLDLKHSEDQRGFNVKFDNHQTVNIDLLNNSMFMSDSSSHSFAQVAKVVTASGGKGFNMGQWVTQLAKLNISPKEREEQQYNAYAGTKQGGAGLTVTGIGHDLVDKFEQRFKDESHTASRPNVPTPKRE